MSDGITDNSELLKDNAAASVPLPKSEMSKWECGVCMYEPYRHTYIVSTYLGLVYYIIEKHVVLFYSFNTAVDSCQLPVYIVHTHMYINM